jgi:hypothetical protein
MRPRQKQKTRCAVRVSGLGFPIIALSWLSVVLRRHAHRMMVMMVTVVVQRSHKQFDVRTVRIFPSIEIPLLVAAKTRTPRSNRFAALSGAISLDRGTPIKKIT